MADFMWEFTMFTSYRELANRNFVAARVRRNEQKGVFIAGVLSLFPQFPSPHACYAVQVQHDADDDDDENDDGDSDKW